MVEIYGYSISTLPIIVALTYGMIEILKHLWLKKYNLTKYIPILSSIIGAVLGIAIYFIIPEMMPTVTWYYSIIIGCASGLSAVGINQIKKQAEKEDDDGEDDGT